MERPTATPHPLPCVVQLGFAGSRRLFGDQPDPAILPELEARVEAHLIECLSGLRTTLGLHPNHFLVGISQIASGADTLFTRACRHAAPYPVPQRVFLPQHREAFLSATGSDGTPDFTPQERAQAETLLGESHLIQERVVGRSADREGRFVDTNVEILRVSDVILCLVSRDAARKPGGTRHLLDRARARGIPALEVRVAVVDGKPMFESAWHNLERWPRQRPDLPHELAHESVRIATEPLPSRAEYCDPLDHLVSSQAQWHQRLFKFSAVAIIATHTLATVCATLAVVLHGIHHERVAEWSHILVPGLLIAELLFLASGYTVHWYLHHSRAARIWAVARLVAELSRSLRSIGTHHVYLAHLFRLSLPHRFRFLLRTLNVLHLRSTWPTRHEDWRPRRDAYLTDRIDDQVAYYGKKLKEDTRRLKRCRRTFAACSLLAIAVTLGKLILAAWPHPEELAMAALGTLAIVLPVVAVGGLSWSAALDCEARVETFGETLDFLERQRPRVEQAETASEFDNLILETETELLGEIANWFSRRSNISVT